MTEHVEEVVLPGDILKTLKESESSGKINIGPGLRRDSDEIVVTKPGTLRFKDPNLYWVDSHHKRYVPVRGDLVLGVVTNKAGDIFRVDIGSSEPASLSYLAFDGASKRNRPDVRVGDLVYGKLLVANKDMEPELVCIDSKGRSSGLGVIRDGGFMVHVSLNLVRKLLSKECILLKTLGNTLPYEVAVGVNGKLWVKGRSHKETVAIVNAISSSEFMTNEQIKVMCRRLIDVLSGF